MTLAEAIRKGAEQCPQAFGAWRRVVEGLTVEACVLGAAALAWYGELGDEGTRAKAIEAFPVLTRPWPGECPVFGCVDKRGDGILLFTLEQVLIHLNDHHRWSRERIADWVERLDATWC